ncbi:predicted protein [Streptomyces sp. AA4]|nr:predicted protein [Streptomyces sp. AA4]
MWQETSRAATSRPQGWFDGCRVRVPGSAATRGRSRYVTTRKEGTHQLRHCYASVRLAARVSIRELAEYLGHAEPVFTLRV